ncbi:hypothetical protein [Fundicoccus culcitae]|uniref:MarR family transcriptional regulator n=1 Tax=Fundicoccus culcitae TaxID=2969821 RepID=A0ABY5P9Z7_9LACT|nr:hypothetical protein [Fundicoccus culcitae]UUX35268.1 hypothetical protein NRE15_06390 [Fundicoccus culcitae]
MSHPKNNGEITHFIIDLMRIIIDGQKIIKRQLELLKMQLDKAESFIESQQLSEEESGILFYFFQNQLFEDEQELLSNIRLSEIMEGRKISRSKIDKVTKQLETLGYLVLVKKKPLVYQLSEEMLLVIE